MKPIIVASAIVLSVALGTTLAHAGGKGGGLGLSGVSHPGPPSSLPPTNPPTGLQLNSPPGLGVASGAGGLNGGTAPSGWSHATTTPGWNSSLAPPPFKPGQ